MSYNVSKLASYILKNHREDMVMLDCTNMIELVNALKDQAVAETAIVLFELNGEDFLSDSPPLEVRELKKATEVKIPHIFETQEVKSPVLIDTYSVLEEYIKSIDPLLKFDEGDVIEFVGNFLHTSLYDSTTEVGKQSHHVKVNGEFSNSAEWITKGGHQTSDGNLFSGYKDTSHVNKAKSKAYNVVGHVFNLLVSAMFMAVIAGHICESYGDDAPDLYKKLSKLATNLVNSQWRELENAEKNWLSLNIWQQLFTLTKNKEGSHNLYKTYANCLWVGTGNNSYQSLNIDESFLDNLESEKSVSAPKPKSQPPVFTPPEGTDKIVTILLDNEYKVKLPQTSGELIELRSVTHECLTYLNTLRGKHKPVDDIKIMEDWLSK